MIDHASTQESVSEGTKTIATFQNAREVNITNATFVLNAGADEGPSRALGIGHLDTARTLPTVTEPVSTASFTTSRSAEDTSANSSQAGNPPHQDRISAAVLVTDGPHGFHTTRHANVGSRVPLTVRADHDIYYSQLLIKGRGSPMWVPGPDLNLPEEYRREGVMIGDIGILYNLEGFSFLFNIFLPADHPINIGRVPDNFEPLDFSKLRHEVKKQTLFGRGDYLASSSVQKLDSVDSSNLIFEASATEGAILTMPDGATTEDLMSRKSIRQYVAKNAESWYWFVREVREREVENGDIRLVVGCDRVSSWGIATFSSSTEHQVRLEFRARDDVSETYMWNCVGTGSGRVGPYEEDIRDLRTDTADLKNQFVFLRTLNFNLTGEIWNNLVVHQVRSLYTSQQGDKAASGRQPGSSGEGSGGGESSSTYGVTFQASQFGSSVVHPANPINRCLMEKYPEARIAITEDEDWMSVISQQDIVFPGPDELCARLLATREISEEDGVVTFKTQEDSPHIENKQLSNSDSSKRSSSNSAEKPRNVVADTDKQELAVMKVVPGELAIIGDPSENREIIYGDQIGMANLSVKDDPGNKVLNSIEMLLEGPFKHVKSDAVGLQEAKSFYFIPPLLRLPYFVGRETLYARLQALFGATTASAPSIVVLIGMGGAGKTQLALEYCRRMKNSGKFRAIFWLDASSRDTLYNSMGTAAKHLIPDRVFDNPDAAVASVNDVLSTWSEQWLLVFDNLDNPEDLPGIVSFFPASHRGSILITSRLAASNELGQSVGLDRMEKEEGLKLLIGSSRGDTDEVDAAEEILSLVGSLPLAIDQAQSYISKRRLGLRVFLTEYEGRKQNFMQETPRSWRYRRVLPGKEKEVSLNLLTTWEMSLQLLGVGEQAAELEKVITLFAFFNPVNVGERLFSNDADDGNPTSSPMTIFKDDGRWNHPKFEDAVVKMTELSLLQFSHCNESEITVSLHSMVSEWLRMRLDRSSQSTFLNIAISHLQSHLGSIGHSDHKTRREAQAHLDTIWRGVESFDLGDHILEACITFGNFYRDQGRLKDAEMIYNRALGGCERMLGPEHPTTLSAINNLGLLYTNQGRLKDAEMMYNRALADREKALGPEHPTTLFTANKKPQNVSVHTHFEDFLNTPPIREFGTSLRLPLFDFEEPHKAEESVLKPISGNVPFHNLTPIDQALQSRLRTFYVGGYAITSGTLQGLVQFLIIGFGLPGHSSYRDTFLTACSELTTPEDLFNILSRRLSEEPHTSNEGCSTQYTIFAFIVYWLSSNCFSPNEELLYRIKIFCEEVIRLYPSLDSIAKETRQLIDLKVAGPALVRASKSREPILRTSDITPRGLAIALGLLEGDNYKALQPFDYLQHLSKGSSDRVRIYITTNEKIRLWVIKSILYFDTVSSQSEVFKFFTKTAFECYSMRNFSSTAAISTALQSAVVGNLKATMTTWKGVSKKTQAKLRVICDIIHPDSNYRGYYEAIRSAATAQEMDTCIPWLVVHLKELYKVVRQPFTVMVDNQHLVNFTRHNQFMDRIKEILYYSPPDLEDRRHEGQLTYLLNQLHDIDLSGDLERQILTKSMLIGSQENQGHTGRFRDFDIPDDLSARTLSGSSLENIPLFERPPVLSAYSTSSRSSWYSESSTLATTTALHYDATSPHKKH